MTDAVSRVAVVFTGGTISMRHDAAAERALLQRGVVLLRRSGVVLCEAASGQELARLSSAPPKLAALAEDMSVALLDEDDVLSLHRLATHLSVI